MGEHLVLIYAPVAQWTRARRYGRRSCVGSNPAGSTIYRLTCSERRVRREQMSLTVANVRCVD